MERSKILDNMIREGTRLEVQALSAERKPLNLYAVLIDYDSDGFLYKGRNSRDSPESAFYVPRNVVAFMKFSVDELQPADSQPDEISYPVEFSGDYLHIGEVLRDFREQAGLTQLELCKQLGVFPNTISNLERGKYPPRGRTLRKYLQLFDIQPPEAIAEIEKMLKDK